MNLIETTMKVETTIHPGEIIPGARILKANTYKRFPADVVLEIDEKSVWEEGRLRELAYNLLALADALEVIDSNNENLTVLRSTEEIVDDLSLDGAEEIPLVEEEPGQLEGPSWNPTSMAITRQFRGY